MRVVSFSLFILIPLEQVLFRLWMMRSTGRLWSACAIGFLILVVGFVCAFDSSSSSVSGVDFSAIPLNVVKARVTAGGGGKPLEFVLRARKMTEAPPGTPDYTTYTRTNTFIPFDPSSTPSEVIDSFFVWLSLDSRKFWVNLKPHEQHLIMDRELSGTFAGRTLLEADLLLKISVGDILHPDSEIGGLFWDNFYDNAERLFSSLNDLCFSFRQWVVPGEVSLVESDDSLFVVRALLDVKLESEYVQTHTRLSSGELITGGCPPGSDPRVQVSCFFVLSCSLCLCTDSRQHRR
jgi:hypothetical protein